jgi:hypothetical protein
MSTPYIPTEAEHDLLDTARRVLGDNLFEFLLSGLGESHHPRRHYTATSIKAHGPGLTYQLEIIGESKKGLPGGRDPVVMAALLHLLLTGGRGRDEVVFRDEELLAILSWPDTRESRLSVKAAVERYYDTAYHRTSREPLGPGRGDWVSAQVQKLVPGYETTQEWEVGTPRGKRKSTILHFTKKLVEEVSGTGKYFLGIDFERLRLERVMPETSGQPDTNKSN